MPTVSRYEIHRGRTNELGRTGTGTATITMIDTNGSLDPSGGGTGYDPMTPVAIALPGGGTLFTGYVSRWTYDLYPTEDYGIATIECVDALDLLAAAEMTVGDYGDLAQGIYEGNIVFDADTQVKNRIDGVLDDYGWSLGLREVFTGNVKLLRTVYAPRQSVLNVIMDAADAEFPGIANVYVQKNGKVTFHGRLARFNPTDPQYGIAIWRAGDLAAVQVDSTRAPIFGLDYDRDKDRIINSAFCTPEGIADADMDAQRFEDATSKAAYGTRSWSAENLVIESSWLTGRTGASECVNVFAKYYVQNYKDPRTRVTRVSFKTLPPGNPDAAKLDALIGGVDISDIIRLKTTHLGGGFDADFYVEGIHIVAKPAGANYLDLQCDLDVSPAAYWNTLPS